MPHLYEMRFVFILRATFCSVYRLRVPVFVQDFVVDRSDRKNTDEPQ